MPEPRRPSALGGDSLTPVHTPGSSPVKRPGGRRDAGRGLQGRGERPEARASLQREAALHGLPSPAEQSLPGGGADPCGWTPQRSLGPSPATATGTHRPGPAWFPSASPAEPGWRTRRPGCTLCRGRWPWGCGQNPAVASPRSRGPGVSLRCPGTGQDVLGTEAAWGKRLGGFASCPGRSVPPAPDQVPVPAAGRRAQGLSAGSSAERVWGAAP